MNKLYIAGAGTGKTSALVKEAEESEEPLAITFSNKSARDLKEKMPPNTLTGTFHFIGYKIIQLVERKQFSVIDTEEQNNILKLSLGIKDKEIIEEIKRHKANGIRACNIVTLPEIKEAYLAYETLCAEENLLDFDEIIIRACENLKKSKNPINYKTLLIDEFQDTNTLQYQFIKLLGKYCPVITVGDPFQCIFSWRGSDINNFKRFQTDFKPEIIRLNENRRSGNEILKLTNRLIKSKLHSKITGSQIFLNRYQNEKEEANSIKTQIQGLKGRTAILCRENSLKDYMSQEILGIESESQKKETFKRICYFTRLIVNENDSHAFKYCKHFFKVRSVTKNILQLHTKRKRTEREDKLLRLIEKLKTLHTDGELVKGLEKILKISIPEKIEDILMQERIMETYTLKNKADISVITLHQSKGLEFENVFIPGIENGYIPHFHSINNRTIEEERRLLHVGMTRARTKLFLSYCLSREIQGKLFLRERSLFIGDIEGTSISIF